MSTMTLTQPAAAADSEDGRRAAYVAGLRAVADTLEDRPEVPLPFEGRAEPLTFHFLYDGDPRAALAAAARALGGTWAKVTRDYGAGGAYFDLLGEACGVRLRLTAYRDAVCERVVTGTEDVTDWVKDPEKLAAVPLVEVTRPVETVEWRCRPVLAMTAGELAQAAETVT